MVSAIVFYASRPKTSAPKASVLDDFKFPQGTEGTSQIEVFGTLLGGRLDGAGCWQLPHNADPQMNCVTGLRVWPKHLYSVPFQGRTGYCAQAQGPGLRHMV